MNPWQKQIKSIVGMCLIASVPALAWAGDGVIEINETAVSAGDITPGDSAGYPVTLSQPGSYRLTSNLSPGSSTGIEVTASDVTIDLNGFSIIGSGSGSGHGVHSELSIERTTVRNGNVVKMGSRGLWLFAEGSAVIDVNADDNGSFGIQMGLESLVKDSAADNNGAAGILISNGGVVINSRAADNAEDGIFAGEGCVVQGCTARSNNRDGIRTLGGCVIKGNSSHFNSEFGLRVLASSGYTENVFISNVDGAVTGSGVQMGDNVCGSVLCP